MIFWPEVPGSLRGNLGMRKFPSTAYLSDWPGCRTLDNLVAEGLECSYQPSTPLLFVQTLGCGFPLGGFCHSSEVTMIRIGRVICTVSL
jgi:hypothetical protein